MSMDYAESTNTSRIRGLRNEEGMKKYQNIHGAHPTTTLDERIRTAVLRKTGWRLTFCHSLCENEILEIARAGPPVSKATATSNL